MLLTRICFNGLESMSLSPVWLCMFIEVLATHAKFLEHSGSGTVIKCTFTFGKTYIFDCFCVVMSYFKLVKHKFPNWTPVHVHWYIFQITHGVKQCTCQTTFTIKLQITKEFLHDLNCIWHVIYTQQTNIILWNFWLTLAKYKNKSNNKTWK